MAVRREKRLALDEAARLAPNDWSSVEVRMLECTERGFRAAGEVTLRVGARVTLDIPGLGPVGACVNWSRNDQFAALFDSLIDLTAVKFMSLKQEAVLARLLTERAAAHVAGKDAEERMLRRRILTALPVKTIEHRH